MASKTFFNFLSLQLRFISCIYLPEGKESLLKTGFEEEQGVCVAPEWRRRDPSHTGRLNWTES